MAQTVEVKQRQRQPVSQRHSRHCVPNPLPQFNRLQSGKGGLGVSWFRGQLRLGPGITQAVKVRPEYAQPVNGNPENDSAKPRGEPGWIAKKIEIQPGAKERFLSYVLGLEPIISSSRMQANPRIGF